MATRPVPPEEDPRETLLSLPRPWLRIGFPTFTALSLVGYAVVIWYAITKTDENGPAGTAYLVVSGFALASGAALGLSIILTEVIRTTMVIADWLDRKYVEPLRRKRAEEDRQREEEIREKGRREANARWREWNNRRLVAEANGEPFDEPPPDDA